MESVVYNGIKIEYTLIRKDVKNINLRIHPDLSISISANPTVSKKTIEEFILSKGELILKNLNRFKNIQENQVDHQYVSGETITVFGKDSILKVKENKKNFVEYDGVNIVLYVKDKNDFLLKQRTMQKWLDKIILQTFTEIFDETYKTFKKYNIDRPQLKLRNMTSKWGSCQYQKGIITMNKALVMYPRECSEYVVMHEFCHFIHPNHSKDFYLFLSMHMPDWKCRKRLLQ